MAWFVCLPSVGFFFFFRLLIPGGSSLVSFVGGWLVSWLVCCIRRVFAIFQILLGVKENAKLLLRYLNRLFSVDYRVLRAPQT